MKTKTKTKYAPKCQIYTHLKLGDFPETGKKCYGLAFGYNHPTALVEIVSSDECFHVRELLYMSGLRTSEMAAAVSALVDKNVPVYCDAAYADSIAELRLCGVNAIASDKDIAGINYVKSRPLLVDPGSVNLINELHIYKWKTDRTSSETIDAACDAMRYAIYTSRTS